MAATRLFSPEPLQSNQQLRLDAAQSRYLTRALRLRVDDTLTVFDGDDTEYLATIVRIAGGRVEISVGRQLGRSVESALNIRLVQGISKGDRMDTVMQKATELGVSEIHPVISQYSVVRLDAKRAANRQQHWRKVAQSACEQCGRNRLPAIELPCSLLDWFGQHAGNSGVRLLLQPGAERSLSGVTIDNDQLTLLIGPEGGFSDDEIVSAAAAGFMSVSLGPRVLRTETAALTAVAVAQVLWGDLSDSGTV